MSATCACREPALRLYLSASLHWLWLLLLLLQRPAVLLLGQVMHTRAISSRAALLSGDPTARATPRHFRAHSIQISTRHPPVPALTTQLGNERVCSVGPRAVGRGDLIRPVGFYCRY